MILPPPSLIVCPVINFSKANCVQEQEYRSFELSLETENDEDEHKEEKVKRVAVPNDSKKDEMDKEVRVGIKDWLVNFRH